jgi:hypothetical protein
MAACDYCGETIVFGGIEQGDLRFCNAICRGKGQVMSASARVPENAAVRLARDIHSGPCPRCRGAGSVDVHTAYWVWSAIVFTRWGSRQQLSCRRCAAKSQFGHLASSAVLGWWGFPWGLIFTPLQVIRNLIALVAPPSSTGPSDRLVDLARVRLAFQPMEIMGIHSVSTNRSEPGPVPLKETWDADED